MQHRKSLSDRPSLVTIVLNHLNMSVKSNNHFMNVCSLVFCVKTSPYIGSSNTTLCVFPKLAAFQMTDEINHNLYLILSYDGGCRNKLTICMH